LGDLLLLIPVVVPDFALLDVTFLVFILVPEVAGAALSSLEAPGAGCVWADAIMVVPTSEAATMTESASLDRMKISPFWYATRDSKPEKLIYVPRYTAILPRKKAAVAAMVPRLTEPKRQHAKAIGITDRTG
jgi:hypothetical protein